MYEIFVQAPDFKGLSVVKQHRLVNEVSILSKQKGQKVSLVEK
jgi:stress-induced morphogen